MRMKNVGWNDHDVAIQVRSIDFVHQSVGRRLRTGIVKDHPYLSLTDKNPIVVEVMNVPALDLSRADRELVDIHQWGRMRRPMRTQNLAQCSALVDCVVAD